MIRKAKGLLRLVFAAGIVGALAFGAQQALASRDAMDPCDCATPGSINQCNTCCDPAAGVCTSGHVCLCE